MNLLKELLFPETPPSRESIKPEHDSSDNFAKADLLWNLIVELRKELIEAQKIRAQILQVKITTISAGIGIIAANIGDVSIQLLVIPALAAIFFDLLINSYGFSIKRIGYYCRTCVEPCLREVLDQEDMPSSLRLWEEFLAQSNLRQSLALWGNLGLTGLAIVVAIISLLIAPLATGSVSEWIMSTSLIVVLMILFVSDIISSRRTAQVAYREYND